MYEKWAPMNFVFSCFKIFLSYFIKEYLCNIMAEGFRFMPLGGNLSAQCMGYLGATLTQVFTMYVTQRCHNSPRWETGLQSAGDVTHQKCTEDFGNLKSVSRVETRHWTRRVDFCLLAETLGRFHMR